MVPTASAIIGDAASSMGADRISAASLAMVVTYVGRDCEGCGKHLATLS